MSFEVRFCLSSRDVALETLGSVVTNTNFKRWEVTMSAISFV